MKAIEVLFCKIDELNTNLKTTENLDEKYKYVELIGDVVNAIKVLGRYRFESISNDEDCFL